MSCVSFPAVYGLQMTEKEWLQCKDPATMVEYILSKWFSLPQRFASLMPRFNRRYTARLRKLHLFGTALWRFMGFFRNPAPQESHTVEVLERYVDRLVSERSVNRYNSERELQEARRAAE